MTQLFAPMAAIQHQVTLVHLLKHRALMTPDQTAYIYLEDGENREVPITYGELDRRARGVAATLQEKIARAHDSRVLLVYPQGLEFLVAFFGSLYAGATAVLVYPPTNKKIAKRLNGIAQDCDVALVLSTTSVMEKMANMAADDGIGSLTWLNTDHLAAGTEARFVEQDISGEHIAFLQYTSGSTGTPKGVMVSHDNLMANQRSIQAIFGSSESSITVGWLPLIHDMGLIGNALHPLFLGTPLVFMSPLHFMQRPARWLRAISKYRATLSGGPNFAYEQCVNKIDLDDVRDLDLSCWKVAFNGAEPVREDTVARFMNKFAACGLSPTAHKAVYGLAEATLIVTGTGPDAAHAADAHTGTMSSGAALPCDVVKIVNVDTGTEVQDGAEGEIWVSGPSVAQGYWNRPDATEETFRARLFVESSPEGGTDFPHPNPSPGGRGALNLPLPPGEGLRVREEALRTHDGRFYMRTGDTGYLKGGEVHITGRIKDIIIMQGKNYHAEDVEWSVNGVVGIRPGCVAAFSVDEGGQEKLVLVAGVTTSREEDWPAVVAQVRSAIYADHQLHLDRIVFIKPKDLPLTTSGKVQRRLTRQMLLGGEFTTLLDQTLQAQGINPNACWKKTSQFVAASTPAERELAVVWGEILNLPPDEVGIHDNFFELGGSSLTMLELATRLNANMEVLFRYPTISGYLYRTSEYEYPDVAADIYLPPAAIDETLQGRTGISLITGGTGFFGLHFLQSMMKRSSDQFVLLVRGKSAESIKKKFDAAVAYFQMQNSIDTARVILMQGDLSQKNAGIPDDQYEWVARNVDRIYHIGSHVNNWLPYEGIREINVDGTRSLLTLARTGRKKEFHYASTSTFSPKKDDQTVFEEGDDIDHTEINRYFGYDISKYASESMCKLARAEGLNCNIYRLVWVGGHVDTGLTKLNDGLNIMLRILLTLGVYPQGNYLHDIVPVDLMADAMASLQGKALNTDYNVTSQSKESIDMKRIAVMLRSMGYDLKEVSRAELVERLRNYPLDQWDPHCKSYRQLVIRLFEDPTAKVESFYDSSNFRQHMDPAVLERMERKFIDSWFEKTVNFLVRSNALPTPTGRSFQEEMARIAQWNDTATPYPQDRCLHELFEAQAQTTPHAVALRFDGKATTYRELDEAANGVARHLIAAGVQPWQFVGLSVNRSPALIASILGIFKAGCAYVPLDPTYPVASLDFMVQDCGATHILVDRASQAQLAHHGEKLLVVDDVELFSSPLPPGEGLGVREARPQIKSTDLAYIIYTSGTTGQPKGVLVEHRSVVNHNYALMKAFGLTPRDRLLQFSTVNFDSFIEEVFPTLFTGATLVLVRKEDLTDVARLQSIIVDNEVSVLKFSTAFWHATCELPAEALGVRLVAIGGEAADVHKYRVWREANPNIPLINTYGPTETTVTASYAVLHGPQERITIGRPIANTQALVLDAQLNPVPPGSVGELYIGGAGVTRGYLNRPENNAQAFLDSPFAPGEKMYKSGDLVRWTQDGELEFLGRTDNQVKVRGYRIELGAIESVIGAHPGVKEVAVVLKEVDTRKKVVAYYTPRHSDLTATALRAYLEEQLPSYMIPNLMLPLDAIPMNPNGKVDRKALELLEVNAAGQMDYAQPTTPSELKMAALWESLLGVSGIGLNDEFMDLGGHSLLVMSLVKEINTQFNTNLSINALYEYPTVAKLLAYVESQAGDLSTSNLIRFPEQGRKKPEAQKIRPLFMVHGLGGHLASFYPLVKNLKQTLLEKHNLDIAVYGLEANGFKAGQAHFANLDEMVAEYIKLIQETQPQGPYLIGGWSYGVSVAFHISQELMRRGEEVEMFISIDAEAPHVPKDFDEFIRTNNVLSLDDLYQDQTLNTLLSKFGARFGFSANDSEDPRQQFYKFLGYSGQDPDDQMERYSKVAIANLFNARDFKPTRISPRNTVLVRASKSNFANYMNDWSDLVDSKVLSAVTLNGDHWSIMQDPELAEQLARCVAGCASRAVELLAA